MDNRNNNQILVFLLLIVPAINGISQPENQKISPGLTFETKVHYGFIYAHNSQLNNLLGQFPAFEISIQKPTSGKFSWERIYDYPILGITFFYSGMGNNPALKQAYALMPFINFPITRNKNFTLGFRLAVGAGYFLRPYDSIKNPDNLAIGSHLNAAINIMFDGQYRINPHLTLTGGISLQHFSNGGWKLPNYGLNIPLINFGVAYHPASGIKETGDPIRPFEEPLPPLIKDRIEINLSAGIAYKSRKETLGEDFLVYHFHENTFFPVSRKSMFGFGFDLFYDPSQFSMHNIDGYTVTNKFQYLIPGINAAYALVVSKIDIILNLGYYTGKIKPSGIIYEKLSLQYNFSEHFFTQVMLKVHGFSASYVTWSMGYKFDITFDKKKGS